MDLPSGEVSLAALEQAARYSAELLVHVGGAVAPRELEGYVQADNERRWRLGLAFQTTLSHWLLQRLLDTHRPERARDYAERLLRSSGVVAPDSRVRFLQAYARLHLVVAEGALDLDQPAEAAAALSSYEDALPGLEEVEGDLRDYEELRRRLAREQEAP